MFCLIVTLVPRALFVPVCSMFCLIVTLVSRALFVPGLFVLNLVPRVLRLLGQRCGRQERLWDNGIFIPRIVGFRFYCACLNSWKMASGCFLRMPYVGLTFLSVSGQTRAEEHG